MSCMPSFFPVWMMPGSMKVLASRMTLATAGVFMRTSIARARPAPSARGTSCCETIPRSDSLTMMRICSRWSTGKTSRRRSSVRAALAVWSVPRTRWPVSEAVMASEIVSRSRISPTMMTSGSSRRAPRSAAPKDSVWVCTSRWFTWQPWGVKRYSIGSSKVMMCSWRVRFTSSTSAARVVLLPLPTEPVTRTSPFWYWVSILSCGGKLSSSIVRTLVWMIRKTRS